MTKKKAPVPSDAIDKEGFDYEEFGEDDYGDGDIPEPDTAVWNDEEDPI